MAGAELLRRLLGRARSGPRSPVLSFGSWDQFPRDEPPVIQVCHPDWRGIRTATYAFQTPVVECEDLDKWSHDLILGMRAASIETVVIQGWPPGTPQFIERCSRSGISAKCVIHSSPALQGDSASEGEIVRQAFELREKGVLAEVAMVKFGVAEAFNSLGFPVTYLPNRAPEVPDVVRLDLGAGTHVGVFGEPWWPKNIVTQVLAAKMLPDPVIHVTKRLRLEYIPSTSYVAHGELRWPDFMTLLGSMHLNLYVTHTECHPLLPVESYLMGVPCLISRTSSLFRNDPWLWAITSVDAHDEPVALAEAAKTLLDCGLTAVDRAVEWIRHADAEAARLWLRFIGIHRNGLTST